MKDNDDEQFEFVHHNVSPEDMEVEFAKFEKVNLKNHVSLSHKTMFAKGPSMGIFLCEEAFGCEPCWHIVPHVQEWPILPDSIQCG